MFRAAFERAHDEIEARKRAQVRLDLALQLGEIGVWEFDPKAETFDADPRALSTVGIPPSDGPLVQRPRWREALHPDDAPEARRLFDALLQGRADAIRSEFRYGTPGGAVHDVTSAAVAVRDDDGTVRSIVGINLDITARKRAELERSKLVHDLGERVKELSLLHATALTQQKSWASTRELLQHVVDRFPPAWQYPEITQARITLGDLAVQTSGWHEAPWMQSARLHALGRSGLIEVVYLEERPLEAEGPFLKEERALLDTVTEMLGKHLETRQSRRELEQLVETRTVELSAARDAAESASRAKGEFLANMSHEIRTPMNAILGYGQLMLREEGLSAEQRRKLEAIRASGDHLLSLINNILDMSRIEAGHASLSGEAFDLRALFADVQSMFTALAAPRGIALEFTIATGIPRAVVADPGKVRQVLINLIGNAMKFTDRGSVHVRASAQPLPGQTHRHTITIAVEDTGSGIGRDDLEHIFTTFGQAQAGVRRGGTGLGLAISRSYARLMDGDITVASVLGHGSTFTFTFVAEATAATGIDVPLGARRPGRLPDGESRRRVLIVDDVDSNREIMAESLGQSGFETRTANSGRDALALHAEWHPALMILDLHMPGMSGLDVILEIRASGSSTPIIVSSASVDKRTEASVLAAGANAFLAKPSPDHVVLSEVARAIGVALVDEPATPRPANTVPATLTPEVVMTIPRELRERLSDAARKAQPARLAELATELEQHDEGAAACVRELTEQFRYGGLIEALKEPA
jgi:PAS domain S-box-containing protein